MSETIALQPEPRTVRNPIPGLVPLLRRQGRIPAAAAGRAAEIERLTPGQHEAALLTDGVVTEEDIAQAVARDVGLPFQLINPLELNPEVVTGALPAPFARRHTICALSRENNTLTIAVANPFDRGAIADLERYLGVRVEVVVATRSDIEGINGSLYNLRTSLRAAETELTHEQGAGPVPGTQEFASESEAAGDLEPTTRPVVAALDSILHQAFEARASDIHLEPKRDRAVVRFRVDGVLRTMHTFPRIVYQAVVSRLKMLSGLDIAEKRRPQDGRFKRIEPDKEIELRVSTLPTVFGEKAVLRVFDPAALVSSLEQLQLTQGEETRLRDMLNRREGLVLVTGPTGSGKTTTLYSVLRHVATPEVNVITIEDPVELIYPPLSQVQVNPRIDLTFAAAIRSVLRQDPDIVMVGEIRDGETAEMAVQAALTGHLVLSTLHTNDAPGAITRLVDLGVPRFLIGTTLVGVVAQRLIRTICGGCGTDARVSAEEAATLSAPAIEGRRIRRGLGCARCRETGYRGRRGVFEILPIDAGAAAEILGGRTAEDLARTARRKGIQSLRQAAVRVLLEGKTTVAEVLRVTGAGQEPTVEAPPASPSAAGRAGGSVSKTEGSADHQEQRRNPVEHPDHVAGCRHAAPDRNAREAAGAGERDFPDRGNRIDEQDPGHIEEEVHDRQLESPVRVGTGDRQGREERGHGRSNVRPQGDRKGVVKKQQAGSREGNQHRGGDRTGLDENGDDRTHTHGHDGVPAENPTDGLFATAVGKGLEIPHQQAESDHQQHHRERREDGGGALFGRGDRAAEPLDRLGDQADDALEGAFVFNAGTQEVAEESGNRAGNAGEESGRHFERQQDAHGQQVEQVVAGGHRERPVKLLTVPEMAEGGECVRDRGSDVGAHHHRDGALEREGGLGRRDEPHDEGTGYGRTLQEGGREDADEQSHQGVPRGLEETVEESGPEALETIAQAVDRTQKQNKEQNEPRETRQLGEPVGEPGLSDPGSPFGHSRPLRTASGGSAGRLSAHAANVSPTFRFVIDE